MARELMTRGFTKVRPLEGGFDAWVNAGHEVAGEGEVLVSVRRRDR